MPQVTDDSGAAAVRRVVYDYVEKGAFRQLKETSPSEGTTEYRFSWLSDNDRMLLQVDRGSGTVIFRGILPEMPERVQKFVADFLAERGAEGELPAHRRVTPDLGELVFEQGDDGRASIGLSVNDDRYADGVRKLVNLVNELLFSMQLRHADYSYTHFSAIDE